MLRVHPPLAYLMLFQRFLSQNTYEVVHFFFEIVPPKHPTSYDAICRMYKISPKELALELQTMVLYCIYTEEGTPIGAVQLDMFLSFLTHLHTQVSDKKLAEKLFAQNKYLELSYALSENYRGKGLGSKAVKAWLDAFASTPLLQHLFAVVSEDNAPSIKILENNHFLLMGAYRHPKRTEKTRVYSYK